MERYQRIYYGYLLQDISAFALEQERNANADVDTKNIEERLIGRILSMTIELLIFLFKILCHSESSFFFNFFCLDRYVSLTYNLLPLLPPFILVESVGIGVTSSILPIFIPNKGVSDLHSDHHNIYQIQQELSKRLVLQGLGSWCQHL